MKPTKNPKTLEIGLRNRRKIVRVVVPWGVPRKNTTEIGLSGIPASFRSGVKFFEVKPWATCGHKSRCRVVKT